MHLMQLKIIDTWFWTRVYSKGKMKYKGIGLEEVLGRVVHTTRI